MSLLKSIKETVFKNSEKTEFYKDCAVEKVEWWLADGIFYPDLFWARLRIFSNGKTDVFFQDEDVTFGFENETFAGYFLSEDEFIRFEELDNEEKEFLKITSEIVIKTPDWKNKEVKNFKYIGTY